MKEKIDNFTRVQINYRILRHIERKYGLAEFYSIGVDSGIRLQGHFNPKIVKKMQGLGMKITTCPTNGYIKGYYKNIINIVLTE